MIANLLIDAIKGAATIVAILAFFFVVPFVMMWFFRCISIGTSKARRPSVRFADCRHCILLKRNDKRERPEVNKPPRFSLYTP